MGLSRREFVAACAGAVVAQRSSAQSGAARRPNLIVLVADDQRWDTMGCAGHPVVRTPHVDSLAARGTLFRNHFVTTAICMSSRASLFTGLYTRCHGIDDFKKALSPKAFAQSYPALLRGAGYRTGFVGKWGLGNPLPKDSFDYWDGFVGQGRYVRPGQKHLTAAQGESAVEFLRGCRRDEPFCLSVSFKAPHSQDGENPKYPYDPALKGTYSGAKIGRPATYGSRASVPAFVEKTLNRTREGPDFTPERYDETMRSIFRLVTGIDDAVGAILAALDELKLADDTVVVYTSDNGFLYGEHGGLAGKWLMYEESIRTPMVVYDPRLSAGRRGTRREEMTLNVDLAPMLLDYAGIEIPAYTQGRSLRPLIEGGERIEWREDWFYEHLFRGAPLAAVEGVREDRWKYVRYMDERPAVEQLFDLKEDPKEERDLAGDVAHAAELARLRLRWAAWRESLAGWKPTPGLRWSEPA